MRVCFVGRSMDQLSISGLSAVLRAAGHETALVFDPAIFDDGHYWDIPIFKNLFDVRAGIVDSIVELGPELLAFSVLSVEYPGFLEVAREAKRRLGVPVVFGGVHPSAVPDVCLQNDCVDYVCVGEGEHAILALTEALEETGGAPPTVPIPNLWWRDGKGGIVRGPNAPFQQDLDALPFPDREIYEDVLDLSLECRVMTARGCPYRCTFCFNNFFAKLPGRGGGKYVRHRSPGNCLEELKLAKARWNIRTVNFADDIFTVEKDWLAEFLPLYRRDIRLPFSCLVHPRFMDRDIARWLADAGCYRVQIGVQTVDDDYRAVLRRVENEAHVEMALRALNETDIQVKVDHILGMPGEKSGAVEDARELYVRHRIARVQTFWLTYFPGTEMTLQAAADGTISAEELDAINRGLGGNQHFLNGWRESRRRDFEEHLKYEVLFRALPLLPEPLRRRARARHVPDMPGRLYEAVAQGLDVLNHLVQLDRDMVIYARNYANHVRRVLLERIGRRRKPRWLPPTRRPAEPSRPVSLVRSGLRVVRA
jgi:anaerobic magnesium-protoporphyrin IX monomethyl ester cyclase